MKYAFLVLWFFLAAGYLHGQLTVEMAKLAPMSALPDNLTSRLERLEQDVYDLKEKSK
jgi:hypothetical protein